MASQSHGIKRYLWIICLIAGQCLFTSTSHAEQRFADSEGNVVEDADISAQQAELVTDDAAYLTQLGLLRGHLMVGFELYQRSHPGMAETHMKHPNEELYADLIPAFTRRGCDGFAVELSELARVVADRESTEVVTSQYESLGVAIGSCEAVVHHEDRSVVMKVVLNLLSSALLEYEIGVVNGVINNVHEYQDAWGFTRVADTYARLPLISNDDEGRLIARQLQRLIASLDPLWPSLNPTRIDDPKVSSLLHRLRAFTASTTE